MTTSARIVAAEIRGACNSVGGCDTYRGQRGCRMSPRPRSAIRLAGPYHDAKGCRDNADGHRIALCGHIGDYDLPGWDIMLWSRGRLTYGSSKTTDAVEVE